MKTKYTILVSSITATLIIAPTKAMDVIGADWLISPERGFHALELEIQHAIDDHNHRVHYAHICKDGVPIEYQALKQGLEEKPHIYAVDSQVYRDHLASQLNLIRSWLGFLQDKIIEPECHQATNFHVPKELGYQIIQLIGTFLRGFDLTDMNPASISTRIETAVMNVQAIKEFLGQKAREEQEQCILTWAMTGHPILGQNSPAFQLAPHIREQTGRLVKTGQDPKVN